MLLPGRLSATTLGDVLGALHRQRATGVLVLQEPAVPSRGEPAQTHRVHLCSGLILGIETGARAPRIGELLRQRGLFDAETETLVEQARRAGDPRSIGELLATEAHVDQSALDDAFEAQRRAQLEALFALDDAALSFHPPRPVPRSARRSGLLTPRDFLAGRRRTRDARGLAEARARALALLGLGPSADRAQIRAAFRWLAAKTHPDRCVAGSAEAQRAAAHFAALSAAYHLLSG